MSSSAPYRPILCIAIPAPSADSQAQRPEVIGSVHAFDVEDPSAHGRHVPVRDFHQRTDPDRSGSQSPAPRSPTVWTVRRVMPRIEFPR